MGDLNKQVSVAISAASNGANSIVAAVSGKKYRVVAWNFMSNGTVNAKWQDGSTDKTGLYYLVANTGISVPNPGTRIGWFETSDNTALNLNLSGAVAVGGAIVYEEVAT